MVNIIIRLNGKGSLSPQIMNKFAGRFVDTDARMISIKGATARELEELREDQTVKVFSPTTRPLPDDRPKIKQRLT